MKKPKKIPYRQTAATAVIRHSGPWDPARHIPAFLHPVLIAALRSLSGSGSRK